MSESGVCHIKAEYVEVEHERTISLDCVSEKDKRALQDDTPVEPQEKKQRLSKAEKKKLKGQNKSRGPTYRRETSKELCNSLINLSEGEEPLKCQRSNCNFLHDINEYLKIKPEDISDKCYNYERMGRCSRGLSCRFGGAHRTADGFDKTDPEKIGSWELKGPQVINNLTHDLQNALRKRNYDFSLSESLIAHNDRNRPRGGNPPEIATNGVVTDEDVVKLKQREKPAINWQEKLCLSPLTTVGNLPFRRICKEFGVDVTCGEMAMCSSLLQGAPQEWALVKRHHSEDVFGVQLCGNNPHLLTKCGQLLQKEISVDFIDLNLGCPIELVYKSGAGCGLLRRTRVLEACIRNLSDILTVPLTVKTRTGVYSSDNIAHTLIPKFRDWGASLVTLHGRSREQRYTKSADWAYINSCAKDVAPFPLMGNGDILSYDDYISARESCPELSGVMIGRGALIKPWIFTEIKERKLWDISSSERFDVLKKYVNYGLEHWGSDSKGVENTRRFMLEWLSFLYRYIPVGLLERPPQKINERPPFYHGRNDLETLMASASAADWIKITEMLLGPVPDNFHFLPKHKANSYK